MTDFQLYILLANIWAVRIVGERYALFCATVFTGLSIIDRIPK